MTPQEIFDKLKENFGESVIELVVGTPPTEKQTGKPVDPYIIVEAGKVDKICSFLRDHELLMFDSLMCLSGVDFGDGKLGTVYHLFSFPKKHKIVIKAIVPKENAEMPTVSNVWLTADWHERESFDLIGIKYIGHPDLRRILLPDDWEGHPLQKDYKVQEFYNGMKVPY